MSDDLARRTHDAIRAVWVANRDVYMGRVDVLVAAATAATNGTLTPDARLEAAEEAHKVAGAVGTFGFAEASAIAKRLEAALRADGEPDAAHLATLAAELRTALAD
jgi:HPt (histidine-containing phosphotransfer) domain-containing protein